MTHQVDKKGQPHPVKPFVMLGQNGVGTWNPGRDENFFGCFFCFFSLRFFMDLNGCYHRSPFSIGWLTDRVPLQQQGNEDTVYYVTVWLSNIAFGNHHFGEVSHHVHPLSLFTWTILHSYVK